jgi:hypothetical protein
MSDYLIHVGGSHYTPESFAAEAREQGVSRRVRLPLPKGLEPGKSRVWCVFGAAAAGGAYHPGIIAGYFDPLYVEFIAGESGAATLEAPVIEGLKLQVIVDAALELPRGCGKRRLGGAYLATRRKPGESPYVELPVPWTFEGAHSRGLIGLDEDTARGMREAAESGEVCTLDMRTPEMIERWSSRA